jgi:hypothetical protein
MLICTLQSATTTAQRTLHASWKEMMEDVLDFVGDNLSMFTCVYRKKKKKKRTTIVRFANRVNGDFRVIAYPNYDLNI